MHELAPNYEMQAPYAYVSMHHLTRVPRNVGHHASRLHPLIERLRDLVRIGI